MMDAGYKHVVTLVHGTFARGAAWCRPDSKLCAALTSEVEGGVHFRVFEWSGKNTNSARLAAARELQSFLRDGFAMNPTSLHHIVAHSHGGNIALYALRGLPASNVRVVTFATPFIQATPRLLRDHVDAVARMLPILIGTLVTACFIFLVSALSGDWFGEIGRMVCWAMVVATVLFAVWFFNPLIPFGEELLSTWLSGTFLTKLQERQADTIEKMSALAMPDLPMLAVYASKDEARKALRLVDRIGESPFVILKVLSLGAGLMAAAMPVLSYLRPLHDLLSKGSEEFRTMAGIVLAIVVGLPILFLISHVPTLIFSLSRRVGYWDDSALDYLLTRLFVSPVPALVRSGAETKQLQDASVHRARSYDLSRRHIGLALRHSVIYEDERVISDVACWISTGTFPDQAVAFEEALRALGIGSDGIYEDAVHSVSQPVAIIFPYSETAGAELFGQFLKVNGVSCTLKTSHAAMPVTYYVVVQRELVEVLEQSLQLVSVAEYFDEVLLQVAERALVAAGIPYVTGKRSAHDQSGATTRSGERLIIAVPELYIPEAQQALDEEHISNRELSELAVDSELRNERR